MTAPLPRALQAYRLALSAAAALLDEAAASRSSCWPMRTGWLVMMTELLAGRPGSFADDNTWGREASRILLGT